MQSPSYRRFLNTLTERGRLTVAESESLPTAIEDTARFLAVSAGFIITAASSNPDLADALCSRARLIASA